MAHLATSTDDRPRVAPVRYASADGHVLATGGRKLANARANPRVAISIEKRTDGAPEWMAVVLGTADAVTDPSRIADAARRVFPKSLGPDESEWDEYYRRDPTDDPTSTLLDVRVGSATATRS